MTLLTNTQEIGTLIQKTRKEQQLTQTELAAVLICWCQVLLLILKKAKKTCEIGKSTISIKKC